METAAVPSPSETETAPLETATAPIEMGSIPPEIPVNESVNVAWGGSMCQAKGSIYYVSAVNNQWKIIRMTQDGNKPTAITTGQKHPINELTSGDGYLYFVSSSFNNDYETDTIYRLPLQGGKAQKVIEQVNVFSLQFANGKLYLGEASQTPDDTAYQIKCVNSDGSGLKTLISLQSADFCEVELYVAGGKIYYSSGEVDTDIDMYSDIYCTDLDGKNAVQLNSGKLGPVDSLFYDQGKLYFLVEQADPDDALSLDPLTDKLETLDEKGNEILLVKNVGYFPQDECSLEYCGISNNVFYYFTYGDSAYFDLHKYNLITQSHTIILQNVDLFSAGTLLTVHGKRISNAGVSGLYILGNDIYFSPDSDLLDFLEGGQ
jgi:hypothetical protein